MHWAFDGMTWRGCSGRSLKLPCASEIVRWSKADGRLHEVGKAVWQPGLGAPFNLGGVDVLMIGRMVQCSWASSAYNDMLCRECAA